MYLCAETRGLVSAYAQFQITICRTESVEAVRSKAFSIPVSGNEEIFVAEERLSRMFAVSGSSCDISSYSVVWPEKQPVANYNVFDESLILSQHALSALLRFKGKTLVIDPSVLNDN